MADVSKIFKPRRGKKSTMAGTKAATVLAAGEMFFEYPDSGVGTGKVKVKQGDGSTKYSALPYAIGETSTDPITFTANTSTTVATALNNVASGATLAVLVAGLKQAISLNGSAITKLNDDISTISTNFQDGCSTIAAAITSKGVTTASNASPSTMATNIKAISTGTSIVTGSATTSTTGGTRNVTVSVLPDIIVLRWFPGIAVYLPGMPYGVNPSDGYSLYNYFVYSIAGSSASNITSGTYTAPTINLTPLAPYGAVYTGAVYYAFIYFNN